MSDTTSVYQAYQGNTYLFGGNAPYVEEMYENYLANPGSVPETWREYFDNLQHLPAVDGGNSKDVPHQPVVSAFVERAKQGRTQVQHANPDADIGRKVNIGAGTITCNYDSVNKHRTIIEDDVFIGSDTQLVAPHQLADGCHQLAVKSPLKSSITMVLAYQGVSVSILRLLA